MNDTFILKKDHLKSLLRKLAKEYRIIAPYRNHHGDTFFTELLDVETFSLDLDNQPQNSIKEFLFPQQETLFQYNIDEAGHYQFTPLTLPDRPTIFFGVRPCDITAILYMDVVFLGKIYKDPHYHARRNKSIIIGLNCNEPFEKCFCNATKNGPFLMEYGPDLQLTFLKKDRYYVESRLANGHAIVKQWQQFFGPADENDTKRQYQIFLEARGDFRQQVHADQAVKHLQEQTVSKAIWEDLSHRCQDCAGCAFICPTCTCFTIADRPLTEKSGERVRTWDACTFAGFTRMAGGHNPVHQKTQAIRQRFMHKLLYDVNKHGRPSCVGCGRCVNICFGGTDIVRFIDLAGKEEVTSPAP